MIVSIHQPNYLPYIGLFDKIRKSDKFVFLDTAIYSKNSVTNRNKIKTSTGWAYLTIPINKIFYQKPIRDVMLPSDDRWMQNHWKSIKFNYSKSPMFDKYRDFFEDFYKDKFTKLEDVNVNVIEFLLKEFGIKTEIYKSSEMDIDKTLHRDEMLIQIIKNLGADTYLAGPSGKNYMDLTKYGYENIKVVFNEFKHPVYKQQFKNFIPNLSAIDLLFNGGKI